MIVSVTAPLQTSSIYLTIHLRNKRATKTIRFYEKIRATLFSSHIKALLKLLIIMGRSWRIFNCLFAYRKQQDQPYEVQHHGCEELESPKYGCLNF